jgi:VanZ family protein
LRIADRPSAEVIDPRRGRYLLALVLALIVYGSLYPFAFHSGHTPVLQWVWASGVNGVRDIALNLVLYVPAGFLIVASSRPRFPVLCATLVTLAVAGTLECLQSFDLGRVSSTPDLLLNVIGGAFGAWTAAHLPARIPPATAVVGIAILARTFPFFPQLHPHLSAFRIEGIFFAAVDWLALRFALTVALKRDNVTRELTWLMLLIPLQVVILDHSASLADVAGGLLALAIGHLSQPRCLRPWVVVSLIGRELLPLDFTSTAQPFHAIPFETYLAGVPAGPVIFLGKLSLYLTAVWVCDPDVRRIWRTAAWMASLVMALEWLQRYLPGRTPDLTESLIVLIAAAVLTGTA